VPVDRAYPDVVLGCFRLSLGDITSLRDPIQSKSLWRRASIEACASSNQTAASEIDDLQSVDAARVARQFRENAFFLSIP
jgi:hypothetical protein